MKERTQANSYFNNARYLAFGGLTRNPFPMAPDDSGFYNSEHTEQIISSFVNASLSKKGFMLFTGDVGLGKTTITRRIISILETHQVETALVLNSFYQENDLLIAINKDFGIRCDSVEQSAQMELLYEFLLKKNREGINCAIIIDDAQNLTFESLELIRMISNLEADQEKLVQILLVGQTELLEKMQSHKLRQLKSRVAVWEKPFALNREETKRYVQYKLNVAGDTGRIQIGKQALNKLYDLSLGNLRQINIIMDRATNTAFQNGSLTIHKKYIEDVFDNTDGPDNKKTNPYVFMMVMTLSILLAGWGIGVFIFYRYILKPLDSQDIIPPPVVESLSPDIPPKKDLYPVGAQNDAFKMADISKAVKEIREKEAAEKPPAPILKIMHFYQGYRGKEIKTLQQVLKNKGLYNYTIDGIVGPILIKGIVQFQKKQKLKATGYPDSNTLFLLIHSSGKGQ